jgi:hypothetical protein
MHFENPNLTALPESIYHVGFLNTSIYLRPNDLLQGHITSSLPQQAER